MLRKSGLSLEQREGAVLRMLRKAEPVVAARQHQVNEQNLYQWREAFLEGGHGRLG